MIAALIAAVGLACPIGVNAGVFGIINGLMIRPLAGADAPGEVVGVFSKDRTAARDYRPFSYPGFSDVRDAGGPFAHLAAHTVALAGVTENNTTRPVTVDLVSTGFFETLGVQPVYGRDFAMDEERPGTAARSVIVSVQSYTITADYFKTIGLRMVQGREFTAVEEATVRGTTPVIIDGTLAERLFANENPVGSSYSTVRIPAPPTRSPWSSSASRPR